MAVQLNFNGPQRKTVKDLDGGEHEYTTRPNESMYFLNCKDAAITVNSRCCKVSIENCKGSKIAIKYTPITSFCEIVNCDGVDVVLEDNVNLHTISIDQSESITIHVNKAVEQLEKVWWHKVSNVKVKAKGSEGDGFLLDKVPGNNKIQKFQHVCKPQPDGTFTKEPVMRENGYPITEKEKIIFDAKQEEFDQKMMAIVKESIRIEKK